MGKKVEPWISTENQWKIDDKQLTPNWFIRLEWIRIFRHRFVNEDKNSRLKMGICVHFDTEIDVRSIAAVSVAAAVATKFKHIFQKVDEPK